MKKKDERLYSARRFDLRISLLPRPSLALAVETFEGEHFAFRLSGEYLKMLTDDLIEQLKDPIVRHARGPEHDHDPPARTQ